MAGFSECGNEHSGSIKCGEFPSRLEPKHVGVKNKIHI